MWNDEGRKEGNSPNHFTFSLSLSHSHPSSSSSSLSLISVAVCAGMLGAGGVGSYLDLISNIIFEVSICGVNVTVASLGNVLGHVQALMVGWGEGAIGRWENRMAIGMRGGDGGMRQPFRCD